MYTVDFFSVGGVVIEEIWWRGCQLGELRNNDPTTNARCSGVSILENLPSSASIASPGSIFSSSEYSGSERASGFASSAFFSNRSLPSQPLLLLGLLVGDSCPSASSPLIEICGGVFSFSEGIVTTLSNGALFRFVKAKKVKIPLQPMTGVCGKENGTTKSQAARNVLTDQQQSRGNFPSPSPDFSARH